MKIGTVVRFNAGRAKKLGRIVDMSSDMVTIDSAGTTYRRRPVSVVTDDDAKVTTRAPHAPIPRRDAPTPHACPRGHSGTMKKGIKIVHNYSSPKINEQNRRHYFRCRVCQLQWTEVRPIEAHTTAAKLTKKGGE